MLQVLILVCSISVAPADCQIETALEVINGPPAENEMMCGLHGQAYIAQTSLVPRFDREYVKLKCLRRPPDLAARHPAE